MRDIINLLESILNEDDEKQKTLSPGVLLKRPGRFEAFINHIASGKEFKTTDGHLVKLDKSEARRFSDLHNAPGGTQFKGNIKVKLAGGKTEIPLSSLLKTVEFGGQKEGSVGGETDPDQKEKGKAGYKFNPANIKITDVIIPAENFGEMIVSNPRLNATPEGRVVVILAQEIMAGEGAILPEDYRGKSHENLRAAITDDAGEYLGVLALLYNQTDFPKRAEFEQWLGGNIEDLLLRFPGKQNERLADSYADLENPETMHKVKISSKGSGGGAPPAMSGLKIPDDIRKNKKFAALVDFIDMVIRTPTKQQPMEAMNILFKHNPSSLPKKFNKFLPWRPRDYDLAEESLQLFKDNRKDESHLPTKYQSIWADAAFRGESSDGGRLLYMVKKAVMDSINENDGIPNFESGVMNILDMNFVQQYATYAKGQLHFKTQWPAKLDGHVTIESKAGSTDPTKGGFSFKLSPKDEAPVDTIGPESSDAVDIPSEPEAEREFAAGAEEIATGSAPAKLTPLQKLEKKREQLQKRIDAFNKKNPGETIPPVSSVGRSMRKR